MRRSIIVLTALVMSLSIGCGRKTDPEAPELFAPNPVLYPSAKGEIGAIVLSWGVPTTDASGKDLVDLSGFIIQRAVYEKDKTPSYDEIAEIPYTYPEVPVAEGKFESLNYRDEKVEVGVRYQYLIFPVNKDGTMGAPQNMVVVTFSGTSSVVQVF